MTTGAPSTISSPQRPPQRQRRARTRSRPSPAWTAALLLLSLLMTVLPTPTIAAGSSFASQPMTFCKCICFGNSTILPIFRPRDPLRPCLTCTRQFCLEQKLPACLNAKASDEDLDVGTGETGDVQARCFQRDSPKSHVLVVLFLVVTSSLLLGAVLKQNGIDPAQLATRSGFANTFRDLSQWTFSRIRGRGVGLNGPDAMAFHSLPRQDR
ncbi:BQ2448_275 [Microbotryum intermedium]|uniref:BQ2448_275 protein n=1 Tax=Microbotryum intermedium TaxID=269621 RepID=A0A238F8F4_9BASI|nr:BQ2448_275 [Microbotryum intermedium]